MGQFLSKLTRLNTLCKTRCVNLVHECRQTLINGSLQCNCGSMFLTGALFYVEQLILKHAAAVRAIRIKQLDQGIYFSLVIGSHGVKFVEFLGKVAPIKSRHDKQLVSHDPKSNNYNYKYTFSVEICPICREDLICLPPIVAVGLGNLGPLVICTKVSNSIALLDPFTLRISFMDAEQYWRLSFKSLLSSKQLVEHLVLDVEVVSSEVNIGGSRYILADAQVARVSDFGKNDGWTIF